ncbi:MULTISPECIES: hypothetical protein [Bacteria]|jgi:hypothetical protein|uniref:Uncharacterized protein n=1 Tax=Staphylococcus pasteuri TaxID=45972 RepID=Q4LAS9_9STAP|nr:MULTISPECIES: hypothetical protein [Bacteria]AGC91752.1 hypothetical protein A284_12372 [Staphylococcus warneri SG1]MDU4435915.1 hypothetical protein [Pluralibacter gergoviae]HAU5931180.1 hypothetical protein [Staphylococcus aureus]HBE8843493.1 hypothetical protein [Clostridioides difficile]HDH6422754.1 hypothetical protein [Staphylococcus aureus MRSA-Lux-33]
MSFRLSDNQLKNMLNATHSEIYELMNSQCNDISHFDLEVISNIELPIDYRKNLSLLFELLKFEKSLIETYLKLVNVYSQNDDLFNYDLKNNRRELKGQLEKIDLRISELSKGYIQFLEYENGV